MTIESPRFNSKKLFLQFSHIGRGFQGFHGILEIYIKVLMMQFCSVPLHISMCTNLRISNSKYGHKQTNSTFGSCIFFSKFLLNIYINSIYLCTDFDLFLLLVFDIMVNLSFKKLNFRRVLCWKGGIYQKSNNAFFLCSISWFIVQNFYCNLNLIFLPLTWVAILDDGRRYQKTI